MILKLAGEVEGDFREVLLCHLQDVVAVSKEYVTAFAVECHELVLALLERFQRVLVVTLDPACLVQVQGFPSALGAILVQQAVLDNLKLQLSYRADDLATVQLADKELRHTFIHKLINAFFQLFLLHWIGIVDVFEHLWREGR